MSQNSFKLDVTRFQKASRRMVSSVNKKPAQDVLRGHMRQFVRKVVEYTPPGSAGVSASGAKKAGENSIIADLLKVLQPLAAGSAPRGKLKQLVATVDQAFAAHTTSRAGASGRVNPRNRKEKLLMTQTDFNTVARKLFLMVGFLAAGWNSAAHELGIRLPAWIARHGGKFGSVKLTRTSAHSLRLTIINDVPFIDGVKGLNRRVQAALDATARDLQKGYAIMLAREARSAGFKR